ncbi:MAG TPA: hypothetical protein VGB44_09935 [Flavobacterium sp.]|jgi:hypothetical protein
MKIFKQIAIAAGLSLAVFFLHYFILKISGLNDSGANAHYSLGSLYLGYSLCSLLIILILVKVRTISIDYVGYTYVLLTGLKMLISFGIFYWSIHEVTIPLSPLERKNIMVVFIYFLAVETVIAIRILNSRQ